MRAKEVVTLWIENRPVGGGTPGFYEYTDGIISLDIRRGMNEYLGPHTQIDTGSLIVTSRNPNLDPMAAGSLVRYKNRIKVQVDDQIIFIGRIENIDVKYQPKNDPPIITVTAFDYVRDLVENRWTNQTYLDEAYDVFTELVGASYGGAGDNDPSSPPTQLPWALDRDPDYFYNRIEGGASCPQLMQYIDYRDMITDFELASTIFREPSIYQGTYTEELWNQGNWVGQGYYNFKLNDSYYSIFNKFAIANLGWFYCTADGKWNYVGRRGDNPGTHRIDFSSEGQPGTQSYRAINITDGFERIYNKVTQISQQGSPYTATPTPESTNVSTQDEIGSQGLWGTRDLSLTIAGVQGAIYSNYEDWHESLMLETAYPHREVSSITWNGMKNHNVAKLTDINDEIGIQYVSDIVSISANYRIVGIRHRIDSEDWIIEYILRNYDYSIGVGEIELPVIVASDTNVTNTEPVNFSVSNNTNFFSVSWNFGDGVGTSTSFTPTYTFENVPPPGTPYYVTVTGVDLLGRTVTSAAVAITVTGQTPILYNINRLDNFTSDLVGQNWFRINASNYDTLTWQKITQEKGSMWTTGTYTSTNHRRPTLAYPYGAFVGSGSYQTGGTIKPGSMGEVTVRVTGTNQYGTTYRDLTFDSFSTDRENVDFNARYIRIRGKYTGTAQYAYTGSFVTNNYHDINPETVIKNLYTHNWNGIGTIIQAVNNNGTITTHDGTPFDIGTHAGYLTDLDDNTGIKITTNLGAQVATNKYRINPDWYIVIDLGESKLLNNIFPEFDMDSNGFPFRTNGTLTTGDIFVSFSTTQSNGALDTGWTSYAGWFGYKQTNTTYFDAGSAVPLKRYYLSPEY
jgi:hypothetical protein